MILLFIFILFCWYPLSNKNNENKFGKQWFHQIFICHSHVENVPKSGHEVDYMILAHFHELLRNKIQIEDPSVTAGCWIFLLGSLLVKGPDSTFYPVCVSVCLSVTSGRFLSGRF